MVGGGDSARGRLVGPQPLVPQAGGEGAAARPDPPLPQTAPSSSHHPAPAGRGVGGLDVLLGGFCPSRLSSPSPHCHRSIIIRMVVTHI